MTEQEGKITTSEIGYFTASSCQVRGTVWVVQLIAGDVAASGTNATEIPKIAIAMPWPLAKAVHKTLGMAIENYERQEGAIAMPKSIDAQLTRADTANKSRST